MIRWFIIATMAVTLSACAGPWGPMHGGPKMPHVKQDSGHHAVAKPKNKQGYPY